MTFITKGLQVRRLLLNFRGPFYPQTRRFFMLLSRQAALLLKLGRQRRPDPMSPYLADRIQRDRPYQGDLKIALGQSHPQEKQDARQRVS